MENNKFVNQLLNLFGINRKKFFISNITHTFKENCNTISIDLKAINFYTFPKKKKIKLAVNVKEGAKLPPIVNTGKELKIDEPVIRG